MNQTSSSTTHQRKQSPALAWMRRYLRVPVTGVLLASFSLWSTQLKGATLYWDGDGVAVNNVLTGAGLGGATTNNIPTWSTTSSNWWNGNNLAPISLSAWNNAGNDIAVFTGTAGAITLGTGVTVGGLQFNTTGYTLGVAANTNAITFGGTTNNIVLNNIAAATINGPLAGGAGNAVVLTGGAFGGATAGTLTLSGTGTGLTGYSGSTTINNGMTMSLTQNNQALSNTSGITLNGGAISLTNATLAEAGFNRINNSAAITSNGGFINVTNTAAAATPYSETVGAVTLSSGRFNINQANANTGGTQVLILTSLTQTGTASAAVFGGGGLNTTTNRVNNAGFGAATPANQIVGPWLITGTGNTTLTDYVVYDASGNLLPANITASAETAWTTAANSYVLSAGTTLTATRNMTSLRYTGAAASLALGTFNLGTTGILNGGSGLLTISGGAVTLPSTTSANLYLSPSNGQGITISSPINDNGAGVLTLVNIGTNTTTLSSTTSTYSGGTVINAGTISIGANTNLGAATGGLTFNNAGQTAGGLTLTAATTLGTTGTPANRAITLNNGSLATITTGAFNHSFIGNISGTGGFIIAGTSGNTLTFGQAGSTSTYTGPTIINLGTLKAGVANAFGNGSAVTLANVAGTVLDITGFNVAIGSLSGGGTTGGNVTLGAATLTIGSNSENTTFGGVISGTGTIAKTGSGILTLTGSNTFTGTPSITGGLVNIIHNQNLGNGTAISIDGGGIQFSPVNSSVSNDISARTVTVGIGGATFDTNNYQVVLANPIGNTGSGSVTKAGNGTLVLRGANTYTGATTVRNGILRLENGQALGTGSSGVTVQTGAALTLAGVITAGGAGLGGSVTLNGNGSVAGQTGSLVNAAGSNTFAGAIILGSSSVIASDNGTLNLSNTTAVSGSGDLTLTGSGIGTLAAALGHSGGLYKTGSGTWTLTGTGGTSTGALSVTNGTLNFVGSSLGTPSATTLGSATLNLTGGSQSIGDLTLTAGSNSNIIAAASAALTTGVITRNAGAIANFDISASGSSLPTSATGSGANSLLGYARVTDGTGAGIGYVSGGTILRFDATATGTPLTDSSNSATTDYHTNGISSSLAWDNGITTRAVNSLTFDTSGGAKVVHMGAVGNVLTISSGALGFTGGSNGTLRGGQVGAFGSEVMVHQDGAGVFAINSPISGGTGSLIKFGTGTLQLSGGISVASATLDSTTSVTVASTSGLAVGQAVSGGGIAPGTTIASITGATTITLSAPATTSMTSNLTFGSGSSYTGSTQIMGGTLQATSSSILTPGAILNNVAGYQTYTGGPVGPTSAVTLANVAGTSFDVNGNTVVIGSLAGGGLTGGNVNLSGGGTLVIGGGNLIQNLSNVATRTTFDGQITGNGNLVVTGGGTTVLTNSSNNFTGQININSGTLAVTNPSALGSGTSPIFVNGLNSGGLNSTALPAGMLVVDGGLGGSTITRDIVLAGRGNNTIGANFVNIGNNTYSGNISANANTEGRLGNAAGTMTITGTLTASNDQRFYFLGGPGNLVVSGLVSGGVAGTSGINKSSRGGLNNVLMISNIANDYIGDWRTDSGNTLVSNGAQLGLNTASNTKIRGSGGTWEFRTDSAASFAPYRISQADGSQTIFVDRGIGTLGSGGINQTVSFANFAQVNNRTTTFAGRNGYGITLAALSGSGNGVNDDGITVTTNGTTTLTGNVWGEADTTARQYVVSAVGETVITGNVLATGATHHLVKRSAGVLTLGGAASTFTGETRIQQGTLSVSSFGGLNANTAVISIGGIGGTNLPAETVTGTLLYTGAGETTGKVVNLRGTTGGAILLSSGSGPLVFTSAFTATGQSAAGSKTLTLGGTNGGANTIQGAIVDNSGTNITSVAKIGSGAWVLSGANTFTGSTTISGGTLAVQDTFSGSSRNVLPNAGAIIFGAETFTQSAGGTFSYLGAAGSASTEAVGALTPSAGAGTILLTPGAGGSTALTFASLGTVTNGAGINISAASGTVTITGVATSTATTLPGAGHIYINGADFARSNAGAMVTPVYGTDAGFVNAGAALTAASHNRVAANTSTGALTVSSLKIDGAQTVTQTGLLTVNVGANTSGGILQTGGAGTITGTGITSAGTGELVFRVNGSGDQLTLSAPITATTTGGWTKNGAGVLVLNAVNAQTTAGAININEGTVRLQGATTTMGATNFNLNLRQGAFLELNGVNVNASTASVNSLNGAGTIRNGAASNVVLNVGNNNGSGYFTGLIENGTGGGTLSLNKAGTGTLSLTGLNTFTGPLTFSGGTLAVTTLANIGQPSGLGAGLATSTATNQASIVFASGTTGTIQYTGSSATIFQATQTS